MKEKEFKEFCQLIKSNLNNLKKINNPILKERLFFIANKIRVLFLNQKYNELHAPVLDKKTLLDIELNYFFNNILKITIKRGFLEESFKIQYENNNLITDTGIIESETFHIYSKETKFKFNNIILIYQNHNFLVDDLNKYPICIEQEEDLISSVYEKTGIVINDLEELDLIEIILRKNQISYVYQLKYNNQLIIPEKGINYIFNPGYQLN